MEIGILMFLAEIPVADSKNWPAIIEQASKSPLGILALMILVMSLIALIWFRNEPARTKVLIFLALLVGVILYGWTISHASANAGLADTYRVRTIVLDYQGRPVDNAHVWSSLGGEPMKVAGGWQFVIPFSTKPADGKLTVHAAVESAFLDGHTELTLDRDFSPNVTIQLTSAKTARVKGIILDEVGNAIPNAQVTVIGYDGELQVTGKSGGFDLPGHASVNQQVHLHAECPGYQGTNILCAAGDAPCTIAMKKVKLKRR